MRTTTSVAPLPGGEGESCSAPTSDERDRRPRVLLWRPLRLDVNRFLRMAEEVGIDLGVLRGADHPEGVEALLHPLDLLPHYAAEEDYPAVGVGEMLGRTIGDGPLRLPRHVVLG